MKEYSFNNSLKRENNFEDKYIKEEIKRIERTIYKIKLDRNKSDKIRGISFGLSTYMALANIIDLNSLSPNQSFVRNIILITSLLLYLKHKKIGDKKTLQILGLTMIKDTLSDRINEKQKTIQSQKKMI